MSQTTVKSGLELVSVIIPAYKAEHTIRRAIDSVLAQTVPPAEIIVVDDGSPDQQNTVIEEYGDRVRLVRQPNSKTASARNTGLDLAQGDFIAFLDADDYWEPDKLARQLVVFTKHPDLGVVAGAYFVEEPGCERTAVGCNHRSWNDRVLRLRGELAFRMATIIWTGTLLVRREVLESERFESGLEPAEDRDMWMRLVLRGAVYFLSEPLATAVLESGSISRSSVKRDCASMLRVIARYPHVIGLIGSCRWRSHTHYRWSACTDKTDEAVWHYLQSIFFWPLPYSRSSVHVPLARTRLLARIVRQTMGHTRGSLKNDSNADVRTATTDSIQ